MMTQEKSTEEKLQEIGESAMQAIREMVEALDERCDRGRDDIAELDPILLQERPRLPEEEGHPAGELIVPRVPRNYVCLLVRHETNILIKRETELHENELCKRCTRYHPALP